MHPDEVMMPQLALAIQITEGHGVSSRGMEFISTLQ
jgi:hypothetical protein